MQVAFFPWLSLKQPIELPPLRFVPFRDNSGVVPAELKDLTESLDTILTGYVDMRGEAIGNSVVVTHAERHPTWDVHDDDHDLVNRYAKILILSAIAKNDYNTNLGCYTNATTFQFVRQRFTTPVDFIAFGSRRRDGSTMDGGYGHGDVKFSIPQQSRSLGEVCIDSDLALAIVRAIDRSSPTARRLLPALSFFSFANTDSDVMDFTAELILMGACFEQLLGTYGARELSQSVGNLLGPYASVTVDQVIADRPGIHFDPRYEAAQRSWPVHRMWAQELYHLRNAHIHGDKGRTWGWHELEHLVMAAFTFPLLVKLLLTDEGFYQTTDDDRGSLQAIDHLLSQTGWAQRVEGRNATVWQDAVRNARSQLVLQRAITEAFAELEFQLEDACKENDDEKEQQ